MGLPFPLPAALGGTGPPRYRSSSPNARARAFAPFRGARRPRAFI
jgi:hypothetical protein